MSLSDRIVVMNRGVVEQVGSPSEIYNFPKTLFVASFVGTLNVIEGIVRDADERNARIGRKRDGRSEGREDPGWLA